MGDSVVAVASLEEDVIGVALGVAGDVAEGTLAGQVP